MINSSRGPVWLGIVLGLLAACGDGPGKVAPEHHMIVELQSRRTFGVDGRNLSIERLEADLNEWFSQGSKVVLHVRIRPDTKFGVVQPGLTTLARRFKSERKSEQLFSRMEPQEDTTSQE